MWSFMIPRTVLKGESMWPGLTNLSEHPSFLPKGSLPLEASRSKLGKHCLRLLLNVPRLWYCRVVKMPVFLSSIYLPTDLPAYTPAVESRSKRWRELWKHCWDACIQLCLKSSLYVAFPILIFLKRFWDTFLSLACTRVLITTNKKRVAVKKNNMITSNKRTEWARDCVNRCVRVRESKRFQNQCWHDNCSKFVRYNAHYY